MTLSSGNAIVDAITKINFTGDITPRIWRKTITKENGRPYPLARDLLSDFVYFYRATEITDPVSGETKLEKKFEYDMLYKTYAQLQEEYGESAQTLRRAINRLEEIGVIKKHLRTIKKNGMKFNNILFIELVPSVLLELTYPHTDKSEINLSESISNEDTVVNKNKVEPVPVDEVDEPEPVDAETINENKKELSEKSKERKMYGESAKNGNLIPPPIKNGRRVQSKMEGHTENTTEINNIYNINQSNQCEQNIVDVSVTDEMDSIEKYSGVMERYPMPEIKRMFGIENIAEFCGENVTSEDVENLLYIIYDAFNTTKPTISISGEAKPTNIVIKKLAALKQQHLYYAIRQFKGQKNRIRNQTAYMLTVLYKAKEQMALDEMNKKRINQNPGIKQKNKFCNYSQRNYSKDEMSDLERKLINRNRKE